MLMKKKTRRVVAGTASVFLLASHSLPVCAGTSFLGGNAELTQATRVNVDYNNPNAAGFSSSAAVGVLDWSKYNIGAGQSMTYNGAGTTFFNLVDGSAGSSTINGMINGNGNVWVVNPNGVVFGANAQINVGGVFSAVAGAIQNADELRNSGEFVAPVFGEFAGDVEVARGAEFVSKIDMDGEVQANSQISLAGKDVKVGTDTSFDTGSVAIGAAGKATVTGGATFKTRNGVSIKVGQRVDLGIDEVSGGKVTIDVSDFLGGDADINVVEFVDAPGAGANPPPVTFEGGGLEIVTDGAASLDVGVDSAEIALDIHGKFSVNRPLVSTEDIAVTAEKVVISEGGGVSSEKAVSLVSTDPAAGGITAAEGSEISAGGAVEIETASGNVDIGGDITATDGGVVSIKTGEDGGGIKIEGKVTADGGGSFIVPEGQNVVLDNPENHFEAPVDVKGKDAEIAGDNIPLGDIDLVGNLKVDSTGDVTADGAQIKVDGKAEITAGTGVDGGDIVIKGESVLEITEDVTLKANGDVEIENSQVKTDTGDVVIAAKGGDIDVDGGDLAADGGKVQLKAESDGDPAQGGNVTLEGGTTVTASGSDDGDGVSVETKGGDIEIDDSKLDAEQGDVKVGAKRDEATGEGGNVDVTGDTTVHAKGDAAIDAQGGSGIGVNGTAVVEAGKSVTLHATGEGDVTVDTTKNVTAKDGKVTIDADNGAVAIKNATVEAKGPDGSVDVDATKGVTIEKGTQVATVKAEQDVTIDNVGSGDVTVGAGDGTDESTLTAANGKLAVNNQSGAVLVQDKTAVSAKKAVELTAETTATVKDGAKVESLTEDVLVEAKNSIGVNGAAVVEAGKSVTLHATAEGDITVDTTQNVTAKDGKVTIDADNGAVAIKNATVEAKGPDGSVDVDATKGVTIAKGTQTATVKAEQDVTIDNVGDGDVFVESSEMTAGEDMTVKVTKGSFVAKEGALTAGGDFKVSAGAGITLENTSVNAGGEVDMSAANVVNVTGDTGIEAGTSVAVKSTGTGDITMDTTGEVKAKDGDLTVDNADGRTVIGNGDFTAQGGGVRIESADAIELNGKITASVKEGRSNSGNVLVQTHREGGDITVNTEVEAGRNLSVIADNGDVKQNADMTADAGTLDVSAGKGTYMKEGVVSKTEAGGNISYEANGGNAEIASLQAGSGNIWIKAAQKVTMKQNGVISTSGALGIEAAEIGEPGCPLELDIGVLNLMAKNGDLYVNNARAARVGVAPGEPNPDFAVNRVQRNLSTVVHGPTAESVQGVNGVIADNGNVVLNNNGSLEVASVVRGQNVNLGVNGPLTVNGTVRGQNVGLDVSRTLATGPVGAIYADKLSVRAGDYKAGPVNVSANRIDVDSQPWSADPQFALFRTVGDREHPDVHVGSDRVIAFVDGRVADGSDENVNIINAVESFPKEENRMAIDYITDNDGKIDHDFEDEPTVVEISADVK